MKKLDALLMPVVRTRLIEVSRISGKTHKGHPISIRQFETNRTRGSNQYQFFVAFSGRKPVASIRIQKQTDAIVELEASGLNDQIIRDKSIPQRRIQVNLGEYAGRGILPALHAHALEYLIKNHPQVTEAYRTATPETGGWKNKLQELGASVEKGSAHKDALSLIKWDLEKQREERPWKKFLLRESK